MIFCQYVPPLYPTPTLPLKGRGSFCKRKIVANQVCERKSVRAGQLLACLGMPEALISITMSLR
jgi:hypothetical protein